MRGSRLFKRATLTIHNLQVRPKPLTFFVGGVAEPFAPLAAQQAVAISIAQPPVRRLPERQLLQNGEVRPGAFVGGEAPPPAVAVTRAPQKVGQLARVDVLKQLFLVLGAQNLRQKEKGVKETSKDAMQESASRADCCEDWKDATLLL